MRIQPLMRIAHFVNWRSYYDNSVTKTGCFEGIFYVMCTIYASKQNAVSLASSLLVFWFSLWEIEGRRLEQMHINQSSVSDLLLQSTATTYSTIETNQLKVLCLFTFTFMREDKSASWMLLITAVCALLSAARSAHNKIWLLCQLRSMSALIVFIQFFS